MDEKFKNDSYFNNEELEEFKNILRINNNVSNNTLLINDQFLNHQIKQILDDNIILDFDYVKDTFKEDSDKFLYWFDWGKKILNVYNIVLGTFSIITLENDNDFKIPSYSRSIINENGEVYLFGGELNNEKILKNTYYIDLNKIIRKRKTLIQKKDMPIEKYDFTICIHDKYIYLISGKNKNNKLVNSVERYDYKNNSWVSLAQTKLQRFAANAIVTNNTNKIYWFGGRTNPQNVMTNKIEEYCITQNKWRVIKLLNQNIFTPVEISTGIQLNSSEIIIFGGSDNNITNLSKCYIFDYKKLEIKSHFEIQKPNVFIVGCIKYGKYIYSIGNEYYVKQRNIHRYNLESQKWEIIF